MTTSSSNIIHGIHLVIHVYSYISVSVDIQLKTQYDFECKASISKTRRKRKDGLQILLQFNQIQLRHYYYYYVPISARYEPSEMKRRSARNIWVHLSFHDRCADQRNNNNSYERKHTHNNINHFRNIPRWLNIYCGSNKEFNKSSWKVYIKRNISQIIKSHRRNIPYRKNQWRYIQFWFRLEAAGLTFSYFASI